MPSMRAFTTMLAATAAAGAALARKNPVKCCTCKAAVLCPREQTTFSWKECGEDEFKINIDGAQCGVGKPSGEVATQLHQELLHQAEKKVKGEGDLLKKDPEKKDVFLLRVGPYKQYIAYYKVKSSTGDCFRGSLVELLDDKQKAGVRLRNINTPLPVYLPKDAVVFYEKSGSDTVAKVLFEETSSLSSPDKIATTARMMCNFVKQVPGIYEMLSDTKKYHDGKLSYDKYKEARSTFDKNYAPGEYSGFQCRVLGSKAPRACEGPDDVHDIRLQIPVPKGWDRVSIEEYPDTYLYKPLKGQYFEMPTRSRAARARGLATLRRAMKKLLRPVLEATRDAAR